MNLNAPTQNIFLISVILVILAVLTEFIVDLEFFDLQALVLAIVAWAVLAAGAMLKGV